jgi:hypothetical protein
MVGGVRSEAAQVGVGEQLVPVDTNEHPIQSDQGRIIPFVTPCECSAVEVQIQQFKVGNCPPESGEVALLMRWLFLSTSDRMRLKSPHTA